MENSDRCILRYVGLCFLKAPLTSPYNFDSGTAFYNLIVGPHKVKGQQWEKSNLVLNCRLPYLVFGLSVLEKLYGIVKQYTELSRFSPFLML